MDSYNHQKIEKKWQKKWEQERLFRVENNSKKTKFYCLDMFPYPSAYGLHVGHLRGYTFSDLIAKKRKMEGYNVLHPMGWDAFGLPAENFAIKAGVPPAVSTEKAIKNIKQQLISAGYSYDWEREINSSQPEYYKWTQWMFEQLYKAGLVYQKEAPVNFCPSCKTVLANEQIVDGKCERCGSPIIKKYLKQWFIKITNYAEKLLEDLEKLNWPEKIKIMQKNWIGKSEGVTVDFLVAETKKVISVFTTRVDTLFGCTYIVLAPEHPAIKELKEKIINYNEVTSYINNSLQKTDIERLAENKEKTGVLLKGVNVINPINNKEVLVFVADYVLGHYGTGAIMAVPAHDQRDFLFAKKYKIPIIEVIRPSKGESSLPLKAFEEDGILINSSNFNGLSSKKARKEIANYLEKKKLGRKDVYYKMRDWLVSRQRYWGAPIPIIHCPKCGNVLVPEKELPVKLPPIKDYRPVGEGKSPLAKVKSFVETKCPKCGGKAERETDTLDTFVCSSWYYLRYLDPNNKREFASKEKIEKWLPVDLYIGGAEHAVMHLLYVRFFAKFLYEQKLISVSEPFPKLFNQGIIYYEGAKMSKSKGNVVTPDYIFEKYGADTMRLYELFMGPADQATEWSDKGITGCYRFLQKVWRIQEKVSQEENKELEKAVHRAIKKVNQDIENFKFNTAISTLMILINDFEKAEKVPLSLYSLFLKILAPIAPHVCEEIWERLGHSESIFREKWPSYNPHLIGEKEVVIIVQINGVTREILSSKKNLSEEQVKKLVLSNDKIKKRLESKKIRKIVFIPGKLINFVVEE